MCITEIEVGEISCEMCNLIGSCKNDYELFGYDPEMNAREEYIDRQNSNASNAINREITNDIDSYELMSPELERKYCTFCGWEISENMDLCEECTLQTARERDFNALQAVRNRDFELLWHIPYYYNTTSPDEEVFSPSAQNIEYIDMGEEEKEEDHEEEEMEEENEY